jgi:hypothetical protein
MIASSLYLRDDLLSSLLTYKAPLIIRSLNRAILFPSQS